MQILCVGVSMKHVKLLFLKKKYLVFLVFLDF